MAFFLCLRYSAAPPTAVQVEQEAEITMNRTEDQDIAQSRKGIAAGTEESPNRELDAAIAELDATTNKLPINAIKWIREHRDLSVPRLIEVIRAATVGARQGECPEGEGHFLALFLLTELRATEALPVILEAVCLPGELPYELFGDAITSVLSRMLPVLADDPLEVLDNLIANADLNEYVRWEGAQGYILLVRDGRISREEAVGRLADHLRVLIDRGDEPVVGYLVSVLVSLAPAEALELIKEAYDRNMVDLWVVRLAEVEQSISEGELWMEKEMSRCRPTGIDDTIAELENWCAFSEDPPAPASMEPIEPVPHAPEPARDTPSPLAELPTRKTGRNEPCPCRSGKKYKKCCGSNI
jgi:hypothetical protein